MSAMLLSHHNNTMRPVRVADISQTRKWEIRVVKGLASGHTAHPRSHIFFILCSPGSLVSHMTELIELHWTDTGLGHHVVTWV